MKGVEFRGLKVPLRAKFWIAEQKSNIRLLRVDDSAEQEEIQCYSKLYAVKCG